MFQTNVVEEITTHILSPVPQMMPPVGTCQNMIKTDKPQTTKRRMRFACKITKGTDTNTEHTASSRQQWLCERAPLLLYIKLPVLFRYQPTTAHRG